MLKGLYPAFRFMMWLDHYVHVVPNELRDCVCGNDPPNLLWYTAVRKLRGWQACVDNDS